MVEWLTTIIEVFGLLLVAFAVGLVFVPAGLLVLGVEMVAGSVFAMKARKPKPVRP